MSVVEIFSMAARDKTAQEISFDDLNIYDEKGNTPFLLAGKETGFAVMEYYFPASVAWTPEQHLTRLQSMYLANACGLDVRSFPDQPDPAGWTDKYQKLNTVSIEDEAAHARDMLISMTRQILLAPLIERYPVMADILMNKHERKIVEQELATELGQALFGAHPVDKIPMVAMPKILEMTNRWDSNRNGLDIGVEEFRLFNIDTVIASPVQAPNGLWLVPLRTYDDLKHEGDTLAHCLWGHRMACMFDGMNVIGVRYQIDQPAFTAGLIPDCRERMYNQYSEPLGFRNAKAPEKVHEAWAYFLKQVNDGVWGKPKDLIAFNQNKAQMREALLEDRILNVIAGYDPRGEKGLEMAATMWRNWAVKMDDLLRYRKLSLPEMIEKSNLGSAFDRLAVKCSHRRKPKNQLSLF